MANCTFNNGKGNYINYNSIPVDDLFDDEDRVVFPHFFSRICDTRMQAKGVYIMTLMHRKSTGGLRSGFENSFQKRFFNN